MHLSTPPDISGERSPQWLVMVLAVWAGSCCLGLAGLAHYARSWIPVPLAAGHWPEQSALSRSARCPTLVIFIHPHCPCTRATLANLNRLLADTTHKPTIHIVIAPVAGAARSDIVQLAGALPGVKLTFDTGGAEARTFHASVSGDALLYLPSGELRFHGGITPARGHEGDCSGLTALRACLAAAGTKKGTVPGPYSTPPLGCLLSSRANAICTPRQIDHEEKI